jgi:thiazole synthase ThiGH ThiG subunit
MAAMKLGVQAGRLAYCRTNGKKYYASASSLGKLVNYFKIRFYLIFE